MKACTISIEKSKNSYRVRVRVCAYECACVVRLFRYKYRLFSMNEYHIYEELGKGTQSVVYKGRKHKSVEYVAVKSVEKKQMDKVLHEVQVLYRVKHPNILRFYNWYETRNHIWLILEYCTGGDLLQLLTQDARMPEQALKVLGVDLISGLHHLHTLGVLYCDLKPSNVLIDEFGVLKLCDFGLARQFPTSETVEQQGPRRGTPCYMAPELFSADGVYSTASDLWSLGCILYELAVGTPPFVSNNFEELVEMIVWSAAPTLSEEFSLPFRNLIDGLLCKEPGDRLGWDAVLKHPFWDARLTPQPAAIPTEPLFLKRRKKRQDSREPEPRLVAEKTQSRRQMNTGTAPGYSENGTIQVTSGEKVEHRAQARADIMRLSRIVRDNIDADAGGKAAGDGPESEPVSGSHGQTEKEEHPDENVFDPIILPNRDTELDFDDRSEAASHLRDYTIPVIAPDKYTGKDSAPRTTTPVRLLGSENGPLDGEMNESRDESPDAVEGSGTAPARADQSGKQGASKNKMGKMLLMNEKESNHHLLKLVLATTKSYVSPISGDRAIESIAPIRLKLSALPFKHYELDAIPNIKQDRLESHLTKIYRTMSGTSRRKPTVAEKSNVLNYVQNLCKSTRVANILVNSSMVKLFIKMSRKSATPFNIRSKIFRILASMFRHATYISGDLCNEGVMQLLVEMARDPNIEVKRASMSALAELLFYITTEDNSENDASDDTSPWILPGSVVSLIGKCLRRDGAKDDVVNHYATKLLQNILIQGKSQLVARFTNLEIALALRDTLKHGHNEAHRHTALVAFSVLLRRNPKVIHKVVDKLTLQTMTKIVSDRKVRLLQPALAILNITLYHGRSTSTLKNARKILQASSGLLRALIYLADRMTKTEGSLGQTLLCIRLMVEGNAHAIATICDGKFLLTLERIADYVKRKKDKYVHECLNSLLSFFAYISSRCLDLLSERIHSIHLGISTLDRHENSPSQIRYDVFKSSENVESALVILPTLIPLLNSKLLVSLFPHSTLVKSLSRLLRYIINLSSKEWSELQELIFSILEVYSKNPELVGNKEQYADLFCVLLPCILQWIEAPNGNIRILSIKITYDILTSVFEAERYTRSADDSGLSQYVKTFMVDGLLPLYKPMLRHQEPIPQYALKLLHRVLRYDLTIARSVYENKLVGEVVRSVHTRGSTGEGTFSISAHAANALVYIVNYKETNMMDLHELDIANRICKAILSAVREGVDSSYVPLLSILQSILVHACSLQKTFNNVSSEYRDVCDACEDFLASDFVEALKQLVKVGRKSFVDSALVQDIGKNCLELLQELFEGRLDEQM